MMMLYEAETKSIPATDVLAAQVSEADDLTTFMVQGVEANRARLDEVISAHARG